MRTVKKNLLLIMSFIMIVDNVTCIYAFQNDCGKKNTSFKRNNDCGTIIIDNFGNHYIGKHYSFDFQAYYLMDYALSEEKVVFDTTDDLLIYASYDIINNSLEYVVVTDDTITEFCVNSSDLYIENEKHEKIDDFINYKLINLDDDYDLFVFLARKNSWVSLLSDKNIGVSAIYEDFTPRAERTLSQTGIEYTGTNQAINSAIMTVGVYFDENLLKNVGCYSGKVIDISGDIAGAYAIENYYDELSCCYVSLVAIWDIDYTIIRSVDNSCLEAIGSMTKKFNLMFEYNPLTNVASVTQAPASSTYVITRNFDSMFRIFGSFNYSYIGEYGFYLNKGGYSDSPDNLISSIAEDVLGQRYSVYNYATSIYIYIRQALSELESANYNIAKEAYEITNNSQVGYARTVASTYSLSLYKQYSTIEARALIYDYPRVMYGAMYYQVEFDVVCVTNSRNTHHIRINHSKSVVVPI